MTAGYSSWSNDGAVGIPLADLPDLSAVRTGVRPRSDISTDAASSTRVEHATHQVSAYDIERQPACVAVPGDDTTYACGQAYGFDLTANTWGHRPRGNSSSTSVGHNGP